jgi:predicted MPP superfamily phosphohydrolase
VRRLTALGFASVAAGTSTVAYASLWERSAFVLRRAEVPVLAPGSRPLRVLHISDIHMLGRQTHKQNWIRDLARLLPDVVVSTGDNLAGADGVAGVLRAYEPLLDRPGVFVLGSNDYYAPRPKNPGKYFFPGHKRVHGAELPWGDLVQGLRDGGWHDLSNDRAVLEVDGRRLAFRGVDDPHLRLDRLTRVAGRAPAADLAVGVVHAPEPRVLDSFAADGDVLLLCGHTHGGQLRVPGFGALVTNCTLDRARCRGLSRYAGAWLHVSAGLGTSPYAPVRFACRPEASLLTLVAADEGADVR